MNTAKRKHSVQNKNCTTRIENLKSIYEEPHYKPTRPHAEGHVRIKQYVPRTTTGLGFDEESEIPIYGDLYNGEPSRTATVRLDFKPIPGVDDNEFIIQKCINFWEVINNEPKFKNMMVYPQTDDTTEESTEGEDASLPSSSWSSESKICECNKMEEDIKRYNLPTLRYIDLHEIPKLNECPNRKCEGPQPYYKHKIHLQDTRSDDFHLERPDKDILKTAKVASPCKCVEDRYIPTVEDPVANIYKEMEEFDKTHPKSMEPPSHPPSLITATMQRVPYSVYTKPPPKPKCNPHVSAQDDVDDN